MEVQILRTGIKQKVSRDDELKLAIAKVSGLRVQSIDRWLRENDVRLTTVTILDIIRKRLGLDDSEVLTEAKEIQAA